MNSICLIFSLNGGQIAIYKGFLRKGRTFRRHFGLPLSDLVEIRSDCDSLVNACFKIGDEATLSVLLDPTRAGKSGFGGQK